MDISHSKRLLLGPQDFSPSQDDLEVIGAFNPGVAELAGDVVLLVRVAEAPRERRAGQVGLPRWSADGSVVVDWLDEAALEPVDMRVVRVRETGRWRLTFTSHLRLVRCGDGLDVRSIEPVGFMPHEAWEEYGVEDPRITLIGDQFYFTYVAVSRHGVATALASTSDFREFTRHGILFAPENKDVVLFPERIGGRYVAIHRPSGAARFARPAMWLASSLDLADWGRHQPLWSGRAAWESGRVGAGPPPLRIDEGWLAVYHGNRRPRAAGDVGAYMAGALLLAADDPACVLACAPAPILSPQEPVEREGFVPNVVFPTGIVRRGDTLLVYYGASDTFTAVAELSLARALTALQPGNAT